MAEEKRQIQEWEKESGQIIHDVQGTEEVTRKEFTKLANKNGFAVIAYEDRVKFLRANGLKVTRKNLIAGDLRQTKEESDESL